MKLGIAGSGNIVPVFLDAYREVFSSPVYALCGREKSRERLTRLQEEWEIEKIFTDYEEMLSDPAVISNQKQFKELSKEHSDLSPIVEIFERYKKHKQEFDDCEEMISLETNPDMKAMFKQELDELREAIEQDGQDIKIAMLPKDPNENNNVIMEIRAGAGGDEAALFGTELMKMYRHYADLNHWKVEEVNMNYTELGGAKELVFMITGSGVYGKLKFESGVHRVQRVPETESQGRVHTSTVTVAVPASSLSLYETV